MENVPRYQSAETRACENRFVGKKNDITRKVSSENF